MKRFARSSKRQRTPRSGSFSTWTSYLPSYTKDLLCLVMQHTPSFHTKARAEDKPLKTPVTMAAIKADKKLAAMALVKYSRLSVQPVTAEEWKMVCKMGGM